MRAAVFHGPGVPMTIEHVPDPEPGAGEAVIKVGRCGICGSDLNILSGKGVQYPDGTVLGHEYAGEIIALGKDTGAFRIGDRVTAQPVKGCGNCRACAAGYPMGCAGRTKMIGGFAEFMRVSTADSLVLPASLSLADGALVEPLAVGLRGARMAGLRPDSRVLVLGTGPVGLGVLYWARRLGAGRVVAAAPSARRRELALQMGADGFEMLGEDEAGRIAAVLGGPPDVVFECAGVVGITQKAIELVDDRGTVVSMGFCFAADPIIPAAATLKEATIRFSFAYGASDFRACVDAFDDGHVEPRHMITETIGLDALPAACEALRSGGSQTKVHVDPFLTGSH